MDMFPYEVQMAFFVHSLLQDTWDGMNGFYMGKNLSGLGELLDIYEVEDKKTTVYFLSIIDNERMSSVNEEVRRKQQAEKRRGKVK